MSKVILGAVLMGIAVLLGFGTCAVYAATYGEASRNLAAALVLTFATSLGLFLWGTVLVALGLSRK